MPHPSSPPREELRVLSALEGYAAAATRYDDWHWQAFWRANEFPIVEDLLARSTRDGDVVVDVGCGSGSYCVELKERCSMRGIDPCAAMLDVASRKLQATVPLSVGSATAIPYPERSAAGALTCRVLSHEPALDAAAHEVGRVVRPGGVWIAADVHGDHGYQCTRIPVAGRDVFIETHKHRPVDIVESASRSGLWECVFNESYFWGDLLWAPRDRRFSRIDQGGRAAIFYVTMFRRRARG